MRSDSLAFKKGTAREVGVSAIYPAVVVVVVMVVEFVKVVVLMRGVCCGAEVVGEIVVRAVDGCEEGKDSE